MIAEEIQICSEDRKDAIQLEKYIKDEGEQVTKNRKTYNEQTKTNDVFGYNIANIDNATNSIVNSYKNSQRVKNPLSHHIISWSKHETPNLLSIKKAVMKYMKRQGFDLDFGGHPVLCSVHYNTANIHVHIQASRVRTVKKLKNNVVDRYKNYLNADISMREIELEQGWKQAPNANIQAQFDKQGKVQLVDASKLKSNNLSYDSLQSEIKSGKPSFQRYIKAEVSKTIKNILDNIVSKKFQPSFFCFNELHKQLALKYNIQLMKSEKYENALIFKDRNSDSYSPASKLNYTEFRLNKLEKLFNEKYTEYDVSKIKSTTDNNYSSYLKTNTEQNLTVDDTKKSKEQFKQYLQSNFSGEARAYLKKKNLNGKRTYFEFQSICEKYNIQLEKAGVKGFKFIDNKSKIEIGAGQIHSAFKFDRLAKKLNGDFVAQTKLESSPSQQFTPVTTKYSSNDIAQQIKVKENYNNSKAIIYKQIKSNNKSFKVQKNTLFKNLQRELKADSDNLFTEYEENKVNGVANLTYNHLRSLRALNRAVKFNLCKEDINKLNTIKFEKNQKLRLQLLDYNNYLKKLAEEDNNKYAKQLLVVRLQYFRELDLYTITNRNKQAINEEVELSGKLSQLSINTNEKGESVFCNNEGKEIFIDREDFVAVLSKDDSHIELAFTYAVSKFGKKLEATGSIVFQTKIVELAIKNNVEITGDNFSAILYKKRHIEHKIALQKKKERYPSYNFLLKNTLQKLKETKIDNDDIINKTFTAPNTSTYRPKLKAEPKPKKSIEPVNKQKINTRTQYINENFNLSMLNEFLHKDKPTPDFYTSLLVVMQDKNLDLEKLSEFNFLDQNTNSAFNKLLEDLNKSIKTNIGSDNDIKLQADKYFYQLKVSNIISEVIQREDSQKKLNKMIALRNLCYMYKAENFKVAFSKIRVLINSSNTFNIEDKRILVSAAKIMLEYNDIESSKFNEYKVREKIKTISKKIDKLSVELGFTERDAIINESNLNY